MRWRNGGNPPVILFTQGCFGFDSRRVIPDPKEDAQGNVSVARMLAFRRRQSGLWALPKKSEDAQGMPGIRLHGRASLAVFALETATLDTTMTSKPTLIALASPATGTQSWLDTPFSLRSKCDQ